MKKITYKTLLGFVCSLSVLLGACENNRNVEDTNETTVTQQQETDDTVLIVKTGKTAEERLEELRDWTRERTSDNDTVTVKSSGVREEFKRRSAELDAQVDSLSEKSKAEYNQLKNRYNQWEARQQRRQQTPLQPEQVNQWQDMLLREFKDLNTITPQNVREAYLTFMGTVRAKRPNWSQEDWDYVDHIYSKLNQRKRMIDGQMSTSDRLKVKALQTEYLTLEGAADTQSLIGEMQD